MMELACLAAEGVAQVALERTTQESKASPRGREWICRCLSRA